MVDIKLASEHNLPRRKFVGFKTAIVTMKITDLLDHSDCRLLIVGFSFALLFDPVDRGDTFLQKADGLTPNYSISQRKTFVRQREAVNRPQDHFQEPCSLKAKFSLSQSSKKLQNKMLFIPPFWRDAEGLQFRTTSSLLRM
jgi:hypothetical protein